jgi:hypothetical protein
MEDCKYNNLVEDIYENSTDCCDLLNRMTRLIYDTARLYQVRYEWGGLGPGISGPAQPPRYNFYRINVASPEIGRFLETLYFGFVEYACNPQWLVGRQFQEAIELARQQARRINSGNPAAIGAIIGTCCIVTAFAVLCLCDGPLPFGDAVAVSIGAGYARQQLILRTAPAAAGGTCQFGFCQ